MLALLDIGRWTFVEPYPIGNFPPWPLFPTSRTSSPPRQDRSCNPPSFLFSLTIRHRYDFHLHLFSYHHYRLFSPRLFFFFNPVKIQSQPTIPPLLVRRNLPIPRIRSQSPTFPEPAPGECSLVPAIGIPSPAPWFRQARGGHQCSPLPSRASKPPWSLFSRPPRPVGTPLIHPPQQRSRFSHSGALTSRGSRSLTHHKG